MASSQADLWQCGRNLPQCMEYMLDHQIACDATFIVGAEREEVYAHKFMLISRSPVFHAMFEGPLAEKGKVDLPDVEKEIFATFLRYLYTDRVKIGHENVMDLLYIAKKYCVDLLAKLCSEFLNDKLSPDNVCYIMETAHRMAETDIYDKCMAIVNTKCNASLSAVGFLSLCRDCVQKITELEDVRIKEEFLFEHLMTWASAECCRQNLDISWENKRKVLGQVLYNIRFPLMSQEYFAKNIAVTEILTSDEKVDVFLYHNTNTEVPAKLFSCKERFSEIIPVYRFSSTNSESSLESDSESESENDSVDVISFKTSHDAFLHGVIVYGCSDGDYEYDVDVTVRDINCQELSNLSTTLDTTEEDKTYEVKLDSPLRVRAGEKYTVEVEMTGDSTYRGIYGLKAVPYGKGKQVTFMDAPSSPNGTNVWEGQIPGLLLS